MRQSTWLPVCNADDLIAGAGVCVLIDQQQIALMLIFMVFVIFVRLGFAKIVKFKKMMVLTIMI